MFCLQDIASSCWLPSEYQHQGPVSMSGSDFPSLLLQPQPGVIEMYGARALFGWTARDGQGSQQNRPETVT
eukprot:176148-Hanusia_phi.AAC.5